MHFAQFRKPSLEFEKKEQKDLKVKKNSLKFTKGDNPAIKDNQILEFMLNEYRTCPGFLPMEERDTFISKTAFLAASINEEIPITEYVRKEFYFKCAQKFEEAIKADPALIKIEIQKKLRYFDELHSC